MAYINPAHKRDIPHKVRVNRTLDRIIRKAAARSEAQPATYLYLMIEWAIENGAIESLSKERDQVSAA